MKTGIRLESGEMVSEEDVVAFVRAYCQRNLLGAEGSDSGSLRRFLKNIAARCEVGKVTMAAAIGLCVAERGVTRREANMLLCAASSPVVAEQVANGHSSPETRVEAVSDLLRSVGMQQIEKLTDSQLLDALARRLEGNPEASAKLPQQAPKSYEVIREFVLRNEGHHAPGLSSLADATLPSAANTEDLTKIPQLSPEEFFEWFDETIPVMSREELIGQTQAWIAAQAGKDYGSLEANLRATKELRARMAALDIWFACPWAKQGDSKACCEPARLVCNTRPGTKYPHGAFRFEHSNQKINKHGLYSTIPPLNIVGRGKPDGRRRIT